MDAAKNTPSWASDSLKCCGNHKRLGRVSEAALRHILQVEWLVRACRSLMWSMLHRSFTRLDVHASPSGFEGRAAALRAKRIC